MANKTMKTLTIGGNTYEIVDEAARNLIAGKSDSDHTHNYAGSSSAGGAANSVKAKMTVKLNGGTTEGTDLFTYNGSTAKTLNVTPSAIGAAASSHNHAASDINSGTLSSDRLPTVPVTKGGTGATDAATARTNLGITPANIGAQAALGFTPVQQGGGTNQQNNKVYIGWSNEAKLNVQVDDLNLGNLITDSDSYPVMLPVSKGGTGAKTTAAARDNLDVPISGSIASSNMDSITETGLYRVTGTSSLLLHMNWDTNYAMQLWHVHAEGSYKFRHKKNNTWSDWTYASLNGHTHSTLKNSDGTNLRVSLNSDRPIIWASKDDKNVWSLERTSASTDTMTAHYYNTDGTYKAGKILLDSGNYTNYAFSKSQSYRFDNVYNLLDNSDFTLPVNQRGQTSYADSATTRPIDRWTNISPVAGNKLEVVSGGVKLSTGSSHYWFTQGFGNLSLSTSKKYTLYVELTDGTKAVIVRTPNETATFSIFSNLHGCLRTYQLNLILLGGNSPITFKYVALYEGEYTVDTVPKYTPKGYSAELVAALRYFQTTGEQTITIVTDSGGNVVLSDRLAIPMNGNPTLSAELKIKKPSDGSFTTHTGSLTTTDPSDTIFKMYTGGYEAKTVYIIKFKYTASCE